MVVVIRPLPSLVTMHTCPRLGHQEVPARDSQICVSELVAQEHSCLRRQRLRIVRVRRLEILAEELPDRCLVFVNHRRTDMARPIVPDLHDELAEVSLVHLHPGSLQVMGEVHLFAGHRLGLHAQLAAAPCGDVPDNPPRLLRRGGKMHLAAVGLDHRLDLLEVVVQVIQRVLADLPRQRAQRRGIGQLCQSSLPPDVLTHDCGIHRPLELLIPGRLGADRVKIKRRCCGLFQELACVRIQGLVFERLSQWEGIVPWMGAEHTRRNGPHEPSCAATVWFTAA